jgi:hypothetical protein
VEIQSGRSKVKVLVSAQKKGGSTEFHTLFGVNPQHLEVITFNLVHMPKTLMIKQITIIEFMLKYLKNLMVIFCRVYINFGQC